MSSRSPGSHLLQGDPASLGYGQIVSQAVARKPQAVLFQQGSSTAPRHLSARRHQSQPPPPNRRPAIRVSLAPREARGIRLTLRQLLRPGTAGAPGLYQAQGASESWQSLGSSTTGPGSLTAWSLSTWAPVPGLGPGARPVGAPWGRATRPLPTRRPQTRPKFPRPPARRAPTFRAPGF